MTSRNRITYGLVDEVLALDVDPLVEGATAYWRPRDSAAVTPDRHFAARIEVGADAHEDAELPAHVEGKPSLTLDGVALWLDGNIGTIRSAALVPDGMPFGLRGRLDLDAARARVRVPVAAGDEAQCSTGAIFAADAHRMLSIAAALLLTRQDCALLHAGAIISPDGLAWLLVGDSHAGKSTTCLNLIRGGWDYLSDDQVVLRSTQRGALTVIGWQRAFHLDDGWESGARHGRRGEVNPGLLGPGVRRRSAPLGGVLVLGIDADRPTRLDVIASSQALAMIVRQSPWFLADRGVADRGLALLAQVAALPSYSLRLGLDVYRDVQRLLRLLAPVHRESFGKPSEGRLCRLPV